jgi:hypothetical protein
MKIDFVEGSPALNHEAFILLDTDRMGRTQRIGQVVEVSRLDLNASMRVQLSNGIVIGDAGVMV